MKASVGKGTFMKYDQGSLPRILIIDDQYGGVRNDSRNRERESFCQSIGIQDVTGDAETEEIEFPVTEAVFLRGQTIEDGYVRNDLDGTLETVRKGWCQSPRWALLLLDMEFRTGRVNDNGDPQGQSTNGHPEKYFGMTILENLWRDPDLRDIPVVILSAMKREQFEKKSADCGIFETVDKKDLTRECLGQLLNDYGLLQSTTLIGRSVSFMKCLRQARQRARIGNDNILLLGESGSGKEPLARYIHDHSPRHDKPYITVYTQGVPETLVDDRIFGHVKGAYTGAVQSQAGPAEQANHGTLFIDEFGDLPAAIQPKLLRLLDKNTRESQRMGAPPDQIKRLDLQVVLATNRLNILDDDDFRKDLLYRVNIADAIRVPPLSERQEDIPLLAEYFVRKCEAKFRNNLKTESRVISPEAMQLLTNFDWPGNVRQLELAIESAVSNKPKMRFLSPEQLMPVMHGESGKPDKNMESPVPVKQISGPDKACLSELLAQLAAFDFSAAPRGDWAGKLPDLHRAASMLLKAALVATRKSKPDNPEGEIKIEPAVKLAMGNPKITGSQAADIIKRVLKIDPKIHQEAMADSVLQEAWTKAVSLRPPKSSKITKKEVSED